MGNGLSWLRLPEHGPRRKIWQKARNRRNGNDLTRSPHLSAKRCLRRWRWLAGRPVAGAAPGKAQKAAETSPNKTCRDPAPVPGSSAITGGTRVCWLMKTACEVVVKIGGAAIQLTAEDPAFCELVRKRYGGYLDTGSGAGAVLEVDIAPCEWETENDDVQVELNCGRWVIRRGDFQATWDPRTRRGRLQQSLNPYSIDTVLRIINTLLLAEEGGFLLHAASGVRNGRAFLFSGLSGAGKTTLSRLAPPDVTLLTDEISYLRPEGEGYRAHGTPFAGELATLGENISAPVAALYLLAKGTGNRIEEIGKGEAARRLLRNILFFAKDQGLVKRLFESACRFVEAVPAYRLTFFPDERVWGLIQ